MSSESTRNSVVVVPFPQRGKARRGLAEGKIMNISWDIQDLK